MWKKIITMTTILTTIRMKERVSPTLIPATVCKLQKPANSRKRKSNAWIVPRLISNKQKHLERNLLVVPRDRLFTNKLKNKAEFRK